MEEKKENKNRKNESYILESKIKKFDLPTPLLIASKCICKIKIKKLNKTGTGFLIKLTKNNKPFYCLMTCEHVIEKKYFNSNTEIDLYYNYETEKRKIILNKNKRYIKDFLHLNIDGMIVEILESDKISDDYFLSPNTDYINGYSQFINKKIFIFQYPKNEDLSYSKGIIESHNLENNEFTHKASTEAGSSGSPIFLDNTKTVIGIHKQGSKDKNENYGNYIGPIIDNLNKIIIDDSKDETIISSDDLRVRGDTINIKDKFNFNDFWKQKKKIFIILAIMLIIAIFMAVIVPKIIKKEKDKIQNEENKTIINPSSENDEKTIKGNEKEEEEYIYNCYCTQSDNDNCIEWNETINQCYKCNEGYELIDGECFTYSFVATFYSDLDNEKISLFNYDDYFSIIKKIKIDDEIKNPSFNYTFNSQGNHKLYFYLKKKKINSLKAFFLNSNKMKSITFCPQINTNRITDVEKLFYNCSSLVFVNISLFNTENIINFSFMFSDCFSLKKIDLTNLNTQNAESISFMFNNCTSLKSIDLSNFNTEKILLMNDLFNNCNSLTSIDLSNFNTQNVLSISFMFYNCYSLTSVDISNFNTTNVGHMNELFNSCISLTSIDLSKFNTQNVITMTKMFYNCSSLTSINIQNFNTINVGYMNYMFSECHSLQSIDVSHFNTQSLKYSDNMFSNCYSLKAVSLFSYNDQNGFMTGMFYYCYNLQYIDISRIIINKEVDLFRGFNSSGKILVNQNSLDKIENIPFAHITSV